MVDLIDLVKEQGIVNIIEGYRNQIEFTERFQPVLDELKEMVELDDNSWLVFDIGIVSFQLSQIKFKNNSKTKIGIMKNIYTTVRFIWEGIGILMTTPH